MRSPRIPRPSRLSQQTRLRKLEEENEGFREALESIADILEEYGILEPQYPEEEETIPETAEKDEGGNT